MTPFEEIGAQLARRLEADARAQDAGTLLGLAEAVLEHWVRSRGEQPTDEQREGFRLLALHRQGALREPSFNACRESCRELAYHYNLINCEPDHSQSPQRARMMVRLAYHLYLFVAGKLQGERLGEFCCASRPLRAQGG